MGGKAMIVSVVNQKGGVGKSTTAEALIAGLTLKGFKVLGVDLDAQGNLTYSMNGTMGGASSLGVLTGEVKAKYAIQHTEQGDLIPATRSLSGADAIITETGKEYALKEALQTLQNKYHFVIIDTPPALSILTVNALTASEYVIIPAQADIFSLQGIEDLTTTINAVRKYCNKDLEIDGILLTRFNARVLLSKEVLGLVEQLARNLNTRVYDTKIREAIVVKEAQVKKQSLYNYAPNSNVTKDYDMFIDEVLETYFCSVDNSEI